MNLGMFKVRSFRSAVLEKLDQLQQGQIKLMNSMKDVQTAITGLASDIDAELAVIATTLTPAGDVPVAQADIDSAVASITALRGKIQTETAVLTGTPAAAAPVAG